jgi:hypothetical protein
MSRNFAVKSHQVDEMGMKKEAKVLTELSFCREKNKTFREISNPHSVII